MSKKCVHKTYPQKGSTKNVGGREEKWEEGGRVGLKGGGGRREDGIGGRGTRGGGGGEGEVVDQLNERPRNLSCDLRANERPQKKMNPCLKKSFITHSR